MVALGPAGPWTHAGDGAAPFSVDVVPPPTIRPLPVTLRVVTFNVEYRTRAARLIRDLRGHGELARADILLLQEVGPRAPDGARVALLADALGMGFVYGHGLAILAHGPLLDPAVMELPHAALPYNSRRRFALRADLATATGPLRLTCVHLDTRLDGAVRIRQLAPALDDAHPLQIIGGDMNTLPFRFAGGAIPLGRADQAALLDDYLLARGFDTPTRTAGATHRNFLRPRLDALVTRGFAATAAHVARDIHASDHFPVWADLTPAAR